MLLAKQSLGPSLWLNIIPLQIALQIVLAQVHQKHINTQANFSSKE